MSDWRPPQHRSRIERWVDRTVGAAHGPWFDWSVRFVDAADGRDPWPLGARLLHWAFWAFLLWSVAVIGWAMLSR